MYDYCQTGKLPTPTLTTMTVTHLFRVLGLVHITTSFRVLRRKHELCPPPQIHIAFCPAGAADNLGLIPESHLAAVLAHRQSYFIAACVWSTTFCPPRPHSRYGSPVTGAAHLQVYYFVSPYLVASSVGSFSPSRTLRPLDITMML